MCDLSKFSARETIRGFKIVARKLKGKRYFSVAMGFKYPLDGHIPVVKKQRRISSRFLTNIISELSSAYRKNMIGRTSIYTNLADLREDYSLVKRCDTEKGYEVVITRVEITRDIMLGSYAGTRVAAGRHISFIEEVT